MATDCYKMVAPSLLMYMGTLCYVKEARYTKAHLIAWSFMKYPRRGKSMGTESR